MANTLSAVVNTFYKAGVGVPRESIAFINSVDTSFLQKEVAQNDVIKVPVIAGDTIGDYTPAMTTTVGGNTTPETISLTMAYNKDFKWHLTGDELLGLQSGGDLAMDFMRQKVEQNVRQMTNYIEGVVGTVADVSASRAIGTAGTNPFATTIESASLVRQALVDNGCPIDGMVNLIVDTVASQKLGAQVTLNNQIPGSVAGDALASGIITRLSGMNIRESGNVAIHTPGTGAATYETNAGYAKGTTSIVVKTGNGTILPGDCFTIESEAVANKYVVKTGIAAAGDTLVINKPGLRNAVLITKDLTLSASHTANIAMHKSAIKLAVRQPIIPENSNIKKAYITDPVSGLTFLLVEVVGDGMITYRLHSVFGCACVNSEYIIKLLG